MAKHFARQDGTFAGTWVDGDPEDSALVEAPEAPSAQGVVWNGSAWTFPAPALKNLAADKRYRVETSGITALGAPIRTDRESQAMIAGARQYCQATGNPVKWKLDGGAFADISAAQIEALAVLVGDHVQACFAAEAAICAEIEAGAITDAAGVENWNGWPS